jgi:glycine reductase complex component B subunit alpha and beta
MRLELAEFPVASISIGDRFHYDSGALTVDRTAIEQTVLEEKRIEAAWLEVVAPGDRVRITGIRDVVEPRVKVNGGGQVFPGVLGPVEPVGEGCTHRLSGMAVFVTAEYEGTVRAGLGVQRSAILDMWGDGAAASPFSALRALVLNLRLATGLSELTAHAIIQRAAFETAKKLAETTIDLTPANVEIFELGGAAADLPKVLLIQGCLTDSPNPHSGVSYFGLPIRDSLATVIHPNEFLDGAFAMYATRCIAYFPVTWDWQNHPLLLGLYRAHRREVNFLGVILERIRYDTFHGKEVIAHNTAQLATQLGAEAALISWLGSGNAFVDVMLTLRACEQRGIKTNLVTYEYGGKDGVDSPLLFYTGEANAITSTGSRDRWIDLPEAERIVGPYEEIKVLSYPGAPLTPARGPFTLDARDMILGGVDYWGRGNWTCAAY